jgi:DNA helicase-2/ATP-dependent DNA helicase PcrA
LKDIPSETTRPFGASTPRTFADTAIAAELPQAREKPMGEWKDGDRVRHDKFGTGIVISRNERRGDVEVTVVFDGAGIKRLSLQYASLSAE